MAFVEWDEPWPGRSEDGEVRTVIVRCAMTVEDALMYSRAALFQRLPSLVATDEELLNEFLVAHYAFIKEEA